MGCEESIYRSYTPYLTRFRIYKIALPLQTKQKPRRGVGLRQINTCLQVTLLVIFFEKSTFRVWCLYRYLVNAFYAGLFLVLVGATNCGPDSMIAGSITMEVNLKIFSFLN